MSLLSPLGERTKVRGYRLADRHRQVCLTPESDPYNFLFIDIPGPPTYYSIALLRLPIKSMIEGIRLWI
jgi:hypothetical protein